jgi:hypothetical protein
MGKNPESEYFKGLSDYQFGFSDPETFVLKARRG